MFPFCAVGFASSPALAALRMHLGVYPHGGRGPAVRVLLMEKNASEVWLFGEELFDLGVAQVGMNPEAVVDVGAIEILRRFEGNGRYGHRDLLLNFFAVSSAVTLIHVGLQKAMLCRPLSACSNHTRRKPLLASPVIGTRGRPCST